MLKAGFTSLSSKLKHEGCKPEDALCCALLYTQTLWHILVYIYTRCCPHSLGPRMQIKTRSHKALLCHVIYYKTWMKWTQSFIGFEGSAPYEFRGICSLWLVLFQEPIRLFWVSSCWLLHLAAKFFDDDSSESSVLPNSDTLPAFICVALPPSCSCCLSCLMYAAAGVMAHKHSDDVRKTWVNAYLDGR